MLRASGNGGKNAAFPLRDVNECKVHWNVVEIGDERMLDVDEKNYDDVEAGAWVVNRIDCGV